MWEDEIEPRQFHSLMLKAMLKLGQIIALETGFWIWVEVGKVATGVGVTYQNHPLLSCRYIRRGRGVCVCMYLIFFSIFHIFLKILFFLPKEPNPWENERDSKWVMKFIFYFSLMVLKPDCTLVFHGEL